MREIKMVQGNDEKNYSVSVADWWCYKPNTSGRMSLIASINYTECTKTIYDQVDIIASSVDNDALIAIGDKDNYLLWRSDNAESRAARIINWKLSGIDDHQKENVAWTRGLYLVLSLSGKWSKDCPNLPHVKLTGIRKNNGTEFEVSDEINMIVATTKGYVAASDRQLFILSGNPEDMSSRLKSFGHRNRMHRQA